MNPTPCPLCQAQNEDILWQDKHLRIIAVHNEAHVPAFCRVIWHAHHAEMTDLNEAERHHLMHTVFQVESAMRQILRPSKINLASLGNVVPHLHWHIIARFTDDAHFPDPIWRTPQRPDAQPTLPANWLSTLRQALHQSLTSTTRPLPTHQNQGKAINKAT